MSLWRELRRRSVFKVAAAYLVAAWLFVQIVDVLKDPLNLPDSLQTVVVVLLAIGFPFALVFAWVYEVTPEGIKVTSDADGSRQTPSQPGRRLTYVVVGLLVAAVTLAAVDGYVSMPSPEGFGEGSRVAVLPCDDLSPDPSNSFFAVGIHEELLNRLGSLRGLEVISRSSVLQYEGRRPPIPEIADELDVDAVMECSARYAGSRVLLTAQLIDGASDTALWSDSYDRELADVFGIQADIAMNVANALSVEFSLAEQQRIEREQTSSPRAYELYLRALTVEEEDPARGDSHEAHAYLDQAIDLDSNFALAYARKAFIDSQRLYYGGVDQSSRLELERNALENAANALSIDQTIGLAHAALAGVHEVDWNWRQARDAYLRAMQFNSDEPDIVTRFAFFNRAIGNYSESVRLMQRAVELDPGDIGPESQLGISQMMAKNFDAALETFDRVERVEPSANVEIAIANCLNAQGRFDEAAEIVQASEARSPSSYPLALAWRVMAYENAGRADDADRVFNQLTAFGGNVRAAMWAMAYVGRGDADNAAMWLQRAIDEHEVGNLIPLIELKSNLWGLRLLETPRFRKLLDQIGAID